LKRELSEILHGKPKLHAHFMALFDLVGAGAPRDGVHDPCDDIEAFCPEAYSNKTRRSRKLGSPMFDLERP
jgi:hypothetical protein